MSRWPLRARAALQVWRHHRVQALLAVLGVVAGVAGLVSVVAISEGARREFNAAIGALGGGTLVVRSAGTPLPAARVAAVRRILGSSLRQAVPVASAEQALQSAAAYVPAVRVVATAREFEATARLRLFAGRFITSYDQARDARVCVLGWQLGRSLFPRGGVVGQSVRLGDAVYTVVGWLAPTPSVGAGLAAPPDADQVAYVPLVEQAARPVAVQEMILRFTDEADMLRASGAVQRIVEYGADDAAYEYVVPVEMLRQKFRLQRIVGLLLGGTTAVLLAVAGIGIMNTMLMNVLRRRPEIGLRLACGARERDIVAQFLLESALVAVAGGLLGLLAGAALAGLLAWQLGWPVVIGPAAALAGLAAAVAVGIAAGVYPARRAAAVQPLQSLTAP